jgi:hypothetical protein
MADPGEEPAAVKFALAVVDEAGKGTLNVRSVHPLALPLMLASALDPGALVASAFFSRKERGARPDTRADQQRRSHGR